MKINLQISARYYYTACLTASQQAVYRSMLAGFETFSPEIILPAVSSDELQAIFDYVLLDNPLIFFVDPYDNIHKRVSYKNEKECRFKPEYVYSDKEIKEYTEAVAEYLRVFDSIKIKGELDKEIFIYRHCLNELKYNNITDRYSHTILGPVLQKTGVCSGISKFVKLALDYAGVQSLVSIGNGINNATHAKHAWNIVKIDGKTYHLDVTYDMGKVGKVNSYHHFNLSDEDMKKNHIIGENMPPCTTKGMDYYSLNDMIVKNSEELREYISTNLRQGKKDIVYKIVNSDGIENMKKIIMRIAHEQYEKEINGPIGIELNFNIDKMVFEIKYKDI